MIFKKSPPWNVLVFPASSEIGLEIHRSLSHLKEVIVHGANQPGPSVAYYHFARLHDLPAISQHECLKSLQDLIEAQKIDAILPAHDDVVLWLAKHADQLNANVVTSPYAVCSICRSKKKTYEFLKDCVPIPHLWTDDASDIVFPVFVKPDCGQGSQRARMVTDSDSLTRALAAEPDLIVTEYLPYREYTVDCFSHKGRVLYAKARERINTRMGIATLSASVDLPEAHIWATRIMQKLDMQGAWFFQMKEDADRKLKLLEVAPRMAGSMALHRAMGVNFPLLSLYQAAGASDLTIDSFSSQMTLGRSLDVRFHYDQPIEALYIDLDDTLVVRGQVNIELIGLIFQCRNRQIPIHCLTRHKGDLAELLKRHRLTDLFDHIIHIHDDSVSKANYVTATNAVFVDDSFDERYRVAQLPNARCFDPAAALCLLDLRD
jgi:carbamoyl-phosphate synthase large subunit